jgi:hypothetical protein
MIKTTLNEIFVLVDELPKISLINNDILSSHILKYKNFEHTTKTKSNYLIADHQNIFWLNNYIIDLYFFHNKKTLFPIEKNAFSAITLESSDSFISDLEFNSNFDICCMYCVKTGFEKSSILFNFENYRKKNELFEVSISENKLIFFPSYLNFSVTENKNKEDLIFLNLKYKFDFIV